MHNRGTALMLILVCAGVAGAGAQRESAREAGEQFVGVWSGTWVGGGSGGGLELTLERENGKTTTGRVSVTGEPEYKATLTSLAFDGAKMTAKYDSPLDASAEVMVAGTFDGEAVTGTWSVRDKASGNEVAGGTWKAKRAK